VGEDFVRFGIMVPLDYCAKCAPIVEEYLASRDELHERIAVQWETDSKALRDDLLKEHPRMSLPDDF
jgi:2-oxo-4-hydroxy-4-carboxy--5-ureidoimidazoline (OHCU) decarboxylase